jgi:hypothetical protein
VNLADKRPDKLQELQAIASKYLADSVAPFADITASPESAPILAEGWKYPAIVGVFDDHAAGGGAAAPTPAKDEEAPAGDGAPAGEDEGAAQ